MRILAIIPARKNSKRLPGKNIRSFCGTPLVVHSIRYAQSLPVDTVVTSDDGAVLGLASRYGVKGIRRPDELAKDDTPSLPVLKHALLEVEKESGKSYDAVLLLQPTSPIRAREDFDKLLALLGRVDFALTVTDGKPNGILYLWRADAIISNHIYSRAELDIPAHRALDIDTLEDFNEGQKMVQSGSISLPWLQMMQDA